ncbi:MAG TPA: CBS domain-containing protein [Nitrososphaera sp.]|jgi:CBS domain-containing protein
MSIESVTVASIMTREVKTAKESQTVKAAARIMTEKDIGSLVIVKGTEPDRPVGIITERDLVRVVGTTDTSTLQMPLRDIMSKPVVTIEASSSIKDAIQSMELNNFRRLPVVDREKKMVGIVTDKDIFKVIMKSQALITSMSGSLSVEYRPVYERFSEFVLDEMLLPGGRH